MEITRVFESTWIHNLNKILTMFINNPKMSLQDCYKAAAKNKSVGAEEGLNIHLHFSINTLTFELLVLMTENFQKTGINFANPQIKTLLKELKSNLPQEYQTMNGEEFLRLLRQSIAHNSNMVKNFKQQSLFDYNVNLHKKNSGSTSYQFTTMDLLKILEIYDTSKYSDKIYGCVSIEECYDTPSMMLYAKKKLGSFNKFIKFEDANGNVIPMDKYQENAFLRFLLKHKNNIAQHGNLEKYVSRFFPAQENKLNNYEHKSHLLMSLTKLLASDKCITCKEMVKYVKQNDFESFMHFTDPEFMKSVIYSSIAFNIFSVHTNDEIKGIFDKAQINCDDETIRHMRNSFIHGRYFYNFKDGFEIYDGAKQMSHYTTFKLDNIEKIYQTYSKQTQLEVMLQRKKMGYDKDK